MELLRKFKGVKNILILLQNVTKHMISCNKRYNDINKAFSSNNLVLEASKLNVNDKHTEKTAALVVGGSAAVG